RRRAGYPVFRAMQICQPLTSPVIVPDEEAFVVPLAVDEEDATKVAREAILESFFRPYDIKQAGISPTVLVHLPFWRVQASVSGFPLGLNIVTNEQGGLKWVLPPGGARHRDAILLVIARRHFPYEPAMMNVPVAFPFQRMMHAFEINLEEMVPRASHTIDEGEGVEPDVSRAAAEREARERIVRAVQPATARYANCRPTARTAP